MHVFSFAGSTRIESWNKKLVRLANAELLKRGATVDPFELLPESVPVFSDDLVVKGQTPQAVLDLKARVKAADAILICTPEYNYSIPGPLKNLLDWLSRPPKDNPFVGKVSAQMGATTGSGGTLQAQNALRHVLGVALGTWVMPSAPFIVSKVTEALDEKGQFKDAAQQKRLEEFVQKLINAL